MLWDEPKIFFLERRYFFSIILSEFLKNRVALQYLRYTMEMGYKEIGELLNISEDTAKKRGQRLIKKLRKQYEGR